MKKLLPQIEAIAKQAAGEILKIYHSKDFGIEIKNDHSPLTQADLAAHHAIVNALKVLTPNIPVLSEESATIPFSTRKTWQKYWLIDPLDGTKEFIKRNGEFTVNIALIENHKPVLSVVHVPVTDCVYSAADGLGAFKGGSKIQVKKPASNIPIVVGSRSHISADVQHYLKQLGEHEMTAMGSSLKFCLVAEGRADLYPRLGLTSEWDTAAAQCIVEQAGGRVVTLDDKPLQYNTKDSLLNPYFMVYGDESRQWFF